MTQSGKTVIDKRHGKNKTHNAQALIAVACYFLFGSVVNLLQKYVFDVKAPKKVGAIPEKFSGDLLFLIIAVASDSLSFWVFLLGTLCGFFPDFERRRQKGKNGQDESNMVKDGRLEEHENDDQHSQQCKIDDDKDAHNDYRDPHNNRDLIENSESQQPLTESQQLLTAKLISYTDQPSNEVTVSQCAQETKQKPSYEAKQNDAHPHAHPPRGWHVGLCLFFVPGFFNFLVAYLHTVGVKLLQSATTFQIIKGSRIVWIACLSAFVFRTRVFGKSQWTGIAIALTGLILVGCSIGLLNDLEFVPTTRTSRKLVTNDKPSQISSDKNDNNRNYLLGLLLLFAGSVSAAFQNATEEKLYKKMPHTPPMLGIGIEGVFAVFLAVIAEAGILFVFRVPGQLDAFKESVYQLQHCRALWVMFPIYMLARHLTGTSGAAIVKSLSSAARALLEYCLVIVFWAVELIVMGCFYSWAKARQEKLDINKFAFWGEKVGFVGIVTGALLFFQLVKPKCWKNNDECGSKEGCCCLAKESKKEERERLEDKYDLETGMGRRSCDSITSEATPSPADTNHMALIEMVESEKFEKSNLWTVQDISMKKRAARSSTEILPMPQPRSSA